MVAAALDPDMIREMARVRLIARKRLAPDAWFGASPEQGGAREAQRPPAGEWRTWLMLAGRGFGKTRSAAEWVRLMVQSGKMRRVALVGATAADVRDTMVEGPSGILICAERAGLSAEYQPSRRRVVFGNGAVALLYSAEEPDRLRGPQHDAAWPDELAAWERTRQEETWSNLQFGLRQGGGTRQVVTTTPRPQRILRMLVARSKNPDLPGPLRVVVTTGHTLENAANLDPAFIHDMSEQHEGTRLGRQELGGELLEDVEGALWTYAMIDAARLAADATLPHMQRIVIAIDPQGAHPPTETQRRNPHHLSETGIVVVGAAGGRGYILEDLSGSYSPDGWGRVAVGAYYRWKADHITVEINNGGAMVKATLQTVDPDVPVHEVTASRGKITRAEPVAALYQQTKVSHVGSFPKLEDQMTSYDGSGDSPDRMDAMVWGASDILVKGVKTAVAAVGVAQASTWGPPALPLMPPAPYRRDWR